MKLVLKSVTIVSPDKRKRSRDCSGVCKANGFELEYSEHSGLSATVRSTTGAFLSRVEFEYGINCRGSLTLLKNGYQSWSFTGTVGADFRQRRPLFGFARNLQENPLNSPTGKRGQAVSEMFVLLRDSRSDDLLVAHELSAIRSPMGAIASYMGVSPACSDPEDMEQFVSFRLNLRRATMTVVIDIDKKLAAGEQMKLARISVSNGDGLTVLDEWCRRNSNVRNDAVPFFGWCSWYHYYTSIDAKTLRKNLGRAKDLHLPFEVFQIDDGYQSAVGDWLSQGKDFTGEMRALSDEIRTAGYQPGIWIAPFVAAKNSMIAKKRDWLLKTRFGVPVWAGFNPLWGGEFFALDTTHPEVRDYVRECVRTIVHEWQYHYLKLDFLYAACLPGKRHDHTKTRAQIYRDAVCLLREAAGEQAYFLGCGAPLSASAGLFEAMRIGCDVAPRWKEGFPDSLLNSDSNVETRGAIRDSLFRAFMKNCFFMVDPDCLIIRSTFNELSLTEQHTLANAMALCGGLFFLSDDLSTYGAREMKILEPVIELWRACRDGRLWVTNWYEADEVLVCMNSAGYLGIFNLSDHERHCTVPDTVCTPDGRIFDVKYYVARKSLLVRPHGSVVFGRIAELKR